MKCEETNTEYFKQVRPKLGHPKNYVFVRNKSTNQIYDLNICDLSDAHMFHFFMKSLIFWYF